MTDQCAENVWSGFSLVKCSRKAGHGPGEAYCKQHAKKHTPKKDMPTIRNVYKVSIKFDQIELVTFDVVEETKKTLTLRDTHLCLGYSDVIRKGICFDTKAAALEDFIPIAEGKVLEIEEYLGKARANLAWAKALLEKEKKDA